MKTFVPLLSLVPLVTALSCTDANETEWCLGKNQLFPLGTEWTYRFVGYDWGPKESALFRVIKCTSDNDGIWIVTRQISPIDTIWGMDGWEFTIKDSLLIRRHISQGSSNKGIMEFYNIYGEVGIPETLYNDTVMRIIVEKLSEGEIIDLAGHQFTNVSKLKYERQYSPVDENWTNYDYFSYTLDLITSIGVLKEVYHLNERGLGLQIDTMEIIDFKLPGGKI